MNQRRFAIILTGCLLAIIFSSLWLKLPNVTADEPPATPTPLPTAPALNFEQGPLVVKAYYKNQTQINDLASWTEPWEVNRANGYVVLELHNIFDYNRLINAGFRVEVDRRLTAKYRQPNQPLAGQRSGVPGYPCYRTVEETFTSAQDIANNFPDLASWIDIGDSWEKTTPDGNAGYDLMVLKLTNSAISGPKPKLFIMSSVHAREYTPAELNTRFAEYMVSNYGLNADVTWLLDYTEFHLLLQANPDGRKHAESGLLWRKNTNENYCSPTSNSRGADLNRNFEFQWNCCNGSSGSECSETYRGPSPVSEPETQAIQNYVRAIFPDRRESDISAAAPITASGVFLDIHSFSQLVLWPWGFDNIVAPNGIALQTLGRKFAYFNNYYPEQAIGLYPTDGATDDFAYGDLGLAAYTFELGTTFFQNCSTFENTILPDNLPALIYAAKSARAPYLTPAGPDALDITVSPVGVNFGQPITLSATINDSRYNNQNGAEPTQNISRAVYYIDTPHWISNTSVTTLDLSPTDGAFNSSVESVTATINTAGLSSGEHIVFVRGQDASGNWGAVSAEYFYVDELVPNAAFSHTGPVALGTPVYFDNLSAGIPAPAYSWDFGDGIGGSNAENPVYTYTTAGAFTVTLIAGNTLGSSEISHTVEVLSPAYSLAVAAPVSAKNGVAGDAVTYTVVITNTGSATDTFNINGSGLGTAALPAATGPLGPAAAENFPVVVNIPGSAAHNEQFFTTIVAASQGSLAVSDGVALTTTAIIVPKKIYLPMILK